MGAWHELYFTRSGRDIVLRVDGEQRNITVKVPKNRPPPEKKHIDSNLARSKFPYFASIAGL